MTRKDYQKVAAVLAKYRDGHMRLTDNVISDIAIDLAAMFTEDNPNFQQSLFFISLGDHLGSTRPRSAL